MKVFQLDGLQKQLALLAGPIFMETLLVMTLGAVDTIMLSQHSDNSVAAVGMVNQLVSMIFLVFEVTALGTSILCSQYIGAKLSDKVTQTVGVSLVLNATFGLIISCLMFFFAGNILHLMGLRPELMPDGLSICELWVRLPSRKQYRWLRRRRCEAPTRPSIR